MGRRKTQFFTVSRRFSPFFAVCRRFSPFFAVGRGDRRFSASHYWSALKVCPDAEVPQFFGAGGEIETNLVLCYDEGLLVFIGLQAQPRGLSGTMGAGLGASIGGRGGGGRTCAGERARGGRFGGTRFWGRSLGPLVQALCVPPIYEVDFLLQPFAARSRPPPRPAE